jgi:hypothetical protein
VLPAAAVPLGAALLFSVPPCTVLLQDKGPGKGLGGGADAPRGTGLGTALPLLLSHGCTCCSVLRRLTVLSCLLLLYRCVPSCTAAGQGSREGPGWRRGCSRGDRVRWCPDCCCCCWRWGPCIEPSCGQVRGWGFVGVKEGRGQGVQQGGGDDRARRRPDFCCCCWRWGPCQ